VYVALPKPVVSLDTIEKLEPSAVVAPLSL
jgi:hypothetical protein